MSWVTAGQEKRTILGVRILSLKDKNSATVGQENSLKGKSSHCNARIVS